MIDSETLNSSKVKEIYHDEEKVANRTDEPIYDMLHQCYNLENKMWKQFPGVYKNAWSRIYVGVANA